MIQAKKISAFTTAGIFVAIISLVLCTMLLNTSYSTAGISEERKVIFTYQVKNPSNVFISNEHINIINKPTITNNEISYGVNLNQPEDYTQFAFEIENTGNIPIKVKNIHITYPVELQEYVSVSVEGIEENDLIEPGSTYSNIKVITKYTNPLYEEQLIKSILLDDINIEINFFE